MRFLLVPWMPIVRNSRYLTVKVRRRLLTVAGNKWMNEVLYGSSRAGHAQGFKLRHVFDLHHLFLKKKHINSQLRL